MRWDDTPIFASVYDARLGTFMDEPARPTYVYTDPAADEGWPNISEPDDAPPDRFPHGWGNEPTSRDQAAIEAGNA